LSRGEHAILTIEDSGKGIPRDVRLFTVANKEAMYSASQGLGLASMRERLHQIDGHLEIDSTPGKTVITAIVALNDNVRRQRGN
jgi:signal transduction histidine kinase